MAWTAGADMASARNDQSKKKPTGAVDVDLIFPAAQSGRASHGLAMAGESPAAGLGFADGEVRAPH